MEKKPPWRGPLGMNLADLIVLALSGAIILYVILSMFLGGAAR